MCFLVSMVLCGSCVLGVSTTGVIVFTSVLL
jgi:hypothetical protein